MSLQFEEGHIFGLIIPDVRRPRLVTYLSNRTSNEVPSLASIAGGDQHAPEGSEAKLSYGEGEHIPLTRFVG